MDNFPQYIYSSKNVALLKTTVNDECIFYNAKFDEQMTKIYLEENQGKKRLLVSIHIDQIGLNDISE